ncbi:macro domain-containing protein [Streptomyces sp. MBT53]|uniref:macro domain-containing protein n=1 Tax=Streptomyces sp. MBT53 TaxID=1488384 RepID=UPI001F3A13A2|nr:macro domain-containing protein [Streptomyces sp. MBT53]
MRPWRNCVAQLRIPTRFLRLYGTGRARRVFARNTMVAFGGISAVLQFVGQFFPRSFPDPGTVTVVSVVACLVWGLGQARPVLRVEQVFRRPDLTVVVEAGDVFDQPAHLVVGFCDTFDTATADGEVINASSVQGQLLHRRYDGDVRRLDAELVAALAGVTPVGREDRDRKPLGKLDRYPVGTVAVLGARPHLVFAVAYSRIGNDCVAASTVEELWLGLGRLWDALHRHAQLERVAMPLVGSGLSRLDHLDQDSLLRLILMSFVARSREGAVCRELRLVVRPADLERIDMREVAAFLRVLASGLDRV